MNRDEILNIGSGKALDELVATKIMRWRRIEYEQLPPHHWPWLADGGHRWDVPAFSIDIAAAWKVVLKLQHLSYEMSMANRKDANGQYFWGVDFYTMIDEAALDACFTADAPTAPLAICRAALLAVIDKEE